MAPPSRSSTVPPTPTSTNRKLLRPAGQLDPSSLRGIALERRKRQRPFSADAILTGITEAFLVVDDEWRFAYVNRAASLMIGHAPHELLGRVIWEVFPEAAGSQFEQVYRRVLANGISERFVEHYEPLGTTFSVRASPLPGGLSVYFHDVSAEVKVFPRGPHVAASGAARYSRG